MKLLLDFGSNPTQCDYDNVTPLSIAEETGNENILNLIKGYVDPQYDNSRFGGCDFFSFLFGKPEPNVLPSKTKKD